MGQTSKSANDVGLRAQDLGEVSNQAVYHVLPALTAAVRCGASSPGSVAGHELHQLLPRPAADRRHAALDVSSRTTSHQKQTARQEKGRRV
jgi:hypothetical protein